MFYFKACPKCHGDMYLDRDQYGSFVECLHCGLLRDVKVNEQAENGQSQAMSSASMPVGQKVTALVA